MARAEVYLYEGADHGFVSGESPNHLGEASGPARERLIGFLERELR